MLGVILHRMALSDCLDCKGSHIQMTTKSCGSVVHCLHSKNAKKGMEGAHRPDAHFSSVLGGGDYGRLER